MYVIAKGSTYTMVMENFPFWNIPLSIRNHFDIIDSKVFKNMNIK
jgi:hypothetical protein